MSALELNASRFGTLVERLRPARSALSAPLATLSGSGDSRRRSWAVTVIAELYGDQADYLYAVAAGADEQTYPLLAERLEAHASRVVELSESELARPAASGGDQESREQRELLAQRQATAAVTLLRLGRAEAAWPVFRHTSDPRRRSHLIHRVGPYGVPAALVLERLRDEPDASARRALLLSLGEMLRAGNAAHQTTIVEARELVDALFREDGDAGVHGAAEWTLRRWGEESRITRLIQARAGQPARAGQNWEVNGQGQTLVLFPGPVEFEMGSPPDEPERFGGSKESWEQQHRKRIERSYALASTPVTVEQFLRFRAEYRYVESYSPGRTYPINRVTWYEAAAYCNWLSEREGIPRAQWCYDPKQEFAAGMRLPKNHLERRGYRLPTESEWECACRSGTLTSRYYGESVALLRHYAWYTKTSDDLAVGSLKPNDFGLFDMLGNALEWCFDVGYHYQTDDAVNLDTPVNEPLNDSVTRVLRGGGFMYTASGVRSSGRNLYLPAADNDVAFRVARTYH